MCEYVVKYYDGMSEDDPFAAPHKFRSRFLIKAGKQEKILNVWNTGQKRVVDAFVKKVNTSFSLTGQFYVFCIPTNNPIFIEGIKQALLNRFDQAIDGTASFKKNSQVQFGSEEFRNTPPAELVKFITSNGSFIKEIANTSITTALLIDDVLQSGKSMEVLELLIREKFPFVSDLKKCVILKMPSTPEKNLELEEEIKEKIKELNFFYHIRKMAPNCADTLTEIIKRENDIRILKRKNTIQELK